MKRKKIEAIPPMKAKRRRSKEIEMVAASEIVEIDGVKHAIIDIYENKEKEIKHPFLRIVLNDKEFANYKYEKKQWTTQKISCIFMKKRQLYYEEIKMEEGKKDELLKFLNQGMGNEWKTSVLWAEKEIMQEKNDRKYELRKIRLKERENMMPPIPEGMNKWIKELYALEHYLFYERTGKHVTIWCSACGEERTYRTDNDGIYEHQFEPHIAVPKHNQRGRCMCCDVQGTYKAAGIIKNPQYIKKRICTIQPVKENITVIRYFEAARTIEKYEKEEDDLTEIVRVFFYKGKKKIQKDFHKYGSYCGNFWDDCNLYGMANIEIKSDYVYPGTFKQLEDTHMKYCALQQYMKVYDKADVLSYMETYNEFPALEMIVKLGLYKLAREIVNRYSYVPVNKKGKNAQEILMIPKKKIKKLQEYEGEVRVLKILQLNANMDEETEDDLIESGIGAETVKCAIKYMSVKQFMNRTCKYADITSKHIWTTRDCGNMVMTANRYADYLTLREELGYDMTNTVFLYPRDLKANHDKMVEEANEKKTEKERERKEKEFPRIRKMYKKLREEYAYENGKYFIRPAESASEIILEGRYLHHCVGGDTYLNKHNTKQSYILFLRETEEPNTPFVTIEIKEEVIEGYKIKQWYGMHDKKDKPEIGLNSKEIDEWLKNYIDVITKRREKKMQEAVGEIERNILKQAM